ncbi:MAG: recombination protein RecR [Myxococcales bacterium]|jgi:recombination protein RecR|nr:recombination protein RecR [Myxococcales bacterium]
MSSGTIHELTALLSRLPGIGKRTAARLVFHLLDADTDYVRHLGATVAALPDKIFRCAICGNLDESNPCHLCADPSRDATLICVVERIPDLWAVETGGTFRGRYHVLHGLLSPLDGVGPDDLNLALLHQNVTAQQVREVIVATRPSVEGEATALLIQQTLADTGVAVSRIAAGVPHGSEIEYTDARTLERALADRKAM